MRNPISGSVITAGILPPSVRLIASIGLEILELPRHARLPALSLYEYSQFTVCLLEDQCGC